MYPLPSIPFTYFLLLFYALQHVPLIWLYLSIYHLCYSTVVQLLQYTDILDIISIHFHTNTNIWCLLTHTDIWFKSVCTKSRFVLKRLVCHIVGNLCIYCISLTDKQKRNAQCLLQQCNVNSFSLGLKKYG